MAHKLFRGYWGKESEKPFNVRLELANCPRPVKMTQVRGRIVRYGMITRRKRPSREENRAPRYMLPQQNDGVIQQAHIRLASNNSHKAWPRRCATPGARLWLRRGGSVANRTAQLFEVPAHGTGQPGDMGCTECTARFGNQGRTLSSGIRWAADQFAPCPQTAGFCPRDILRRFLRKTSVLRQGAVGTALQGIG